MAIGTLNGVVSIRNIRADLELMSFQQESKITAISFRTDEHPHMATANMHGDVALWDMEKKRLFHTLKGAHDGLIMSMQFLNGQPLMITGGADNAVKVRFFPPIHIYIYINKTLLFYLSSSNGSLTL